MTSELKKALTTTGDGANLVPLNDLEATLGEELLKVQPLMQLISVLPAEGLTHEYRIRTGHPSAWFEGETTPANPSNGTYDRKTVQLKIQRIWGEVTGFAQKVDEKFINALATEIEGSVQGMADLLEYGILWGAADDIGFTGDAYQYSGILPRLFSYAPANVIDAGSDKIALSDLDGAIAVATPFRQVRSDPFMWFMSMQMKQVVDGLQTKVQLPLTTATLADGKIEMAAYGRKPIFESDLFAPTATSPAATAVVAAGGSIPDGTYNYRISSVTLAGEQVAGTASANVVCGTGNNTANLSWTADANAKLYLIWRRLGAGAYNLVDIINAKTYDAAGTVNGNRTTYSDNGSKTAKAVKPLESGEQSILLANFNPDRGVALMGLVDDMGSRVQNFMSYVELARTKDTYPYMVKNYTTLRLKYPNIFSAVRHVKLL